MGAILNCSVTPDYSTGESTMTQTKIEPPTVPAVYGKIAAVQADIAKEGISKDRSNSQQNYNFRGIDDVYNALAPLLAKHGLCVLPRMLSRRREERISIKEWNGQKKESVLFYVTVEAEFDFIAAVDGSCHVVRTFGEAMDSGDKATNKAMSAAYKYAAFMAFAIPTEGDNDADAVTHVVEPKKQRAASPQEMTDDQWSRIVKLAEATGVKSGPLGKEIGVKNVKDFDFAQANKAIEYLEGVLAEKAKAESNKAGATQEYADDDIAY